MTLGRKKNILDEDKYLSDLEHIIKRDFFPDSDILELQLKYYDAMDAQDLCTVKEIQLQLNKINEAFENTRTFEENLKSSTDSIPYKNPSALEERDLRLNEYLSRNTSEDNDSYTDLQKKIIERQMNKLSWAFKAAKEYNETRFHSLENKEVILAISNGDEKISTPPKCDSTNVMEYKVFNPVFFNPSSVSLSAAEYVSLSGKKKKIIYENTRFKTPLNFVRSRPKTNQVKTKVPGKVGHDGKEVSGNGTPRIAGYSILGRMDTPDMVTPNTTWGYIDGTPMEIPDSPMVSRFRIQEPSEREKLATEMASKLARRHKDKKQQALDRVKSNLNRPSSSRSIVSPAAIRLLSRMTPSTPKSGATSSSRPGSVLLPSAKNTPLADRYPITPRNNNNRVYSITDNLLDI